MSDGLRPRRKLADAERPEVNSDRFGDISFALARTARPQRTDFPSRAFFASRSRWASKEAIE